MFSGSCAENKQFLLNHKPETEDSGLGSPGPRWVPEHIHSHQRPLGAGTRTEDTGCLFVCISAGLLGSVQTLTAVLPVRTGTGSNAGFTASSHCSIFGATFSCSDVCSTSYSQQPLVTSDTTSVIQVFSKT